MLWLCITLMRIHIRLITLMRIRIRILIFIWCECRSRSNFSLWGRSCFLCGSGSGPRGNFIDFSVIFLNLTKYQLVNKKGLCGPDAHFTLMRVPILIFFYWGSGAGLLSWCGCGSGNRSRFPKWCGFRTGCGSESTTLPERDRPASEIVLGGVPLDRPRLVQNMNIYWF
jgi:hypothetical protein